MTIKGSLARASTNTPFNDILWDSEGYPVRKGDRVAIVNKSETSMHHGKIISVYSTECKVKIDESGKSSAKPIQIRADEISGQYNRLVSVTAKQERRKKNPSAQITQPPRGTLKGRGLGQ